MYLLIGKNRRLSGQMTVFLLNNYAGMQF